MCGTCRFCLGFFQVAAIGSGALMITVTSMFYIYGGMPPTFAMAMGFWLQYAVGWLAIYVSIYIVRVLGKGLFTTWTPKYCFALIIIVIILYMAGAICFFVPVTKARMIEYSRWYNASYGGIPRFLDKFQQQYDCCGINDYTDYNNPKIFGVKHRRKRVVYNGISPRDPAWLDDQDEYAQKLKDKKISSNTKSRVQYFFHVPSTCCKHDRQIKFKKCGEFIEYEWEDYKNNYKDTNGTFKPDPSALIMINNPHKGCFQKYLVVMGNSIFQVNWMIGITQWGSLFQCTFFFALIWIYRSSLRSMRRNFKDELHEEEKSFFVEDEVKVSPDADNKGNKSGANATESENKDVVEIKRASQNLGDSKNESTVTSEAESFFASDNKVGV